MKRIATLLIAALAIPAAMAAEPTHLLHSPVMNRTQIVFAYAGDLWTVLRQGGAAARLTAGAGIESNPVFSPDGSTIAVTREDPRNTRVSPIPPSRGRPPRLNDPSR